MLQGEAVLDVRPLGLSDGIELAVDPKSQRMQKAATARDDWSCSPGVLVYLKKEVELGVRVFVVSKVVANIFQLHLRQDGLVLVNPPK